MNLWTVDTTEGGLAALRVLECSQDFGIAPRVLELLPGFWSKMLKFIQPFMKSPLKRVHLNENWKKSSVVSLADQNYMIAIGDLAWNLRFFLQISEQRQ